MTEPNAKNNLFNKSFDQIMKERDAFLENISPNLNDDWYATLRQYAAFAAENGDLDGFEKCTKKDRFWETGVWKDNDGETLLHYACRGGNAKIIEQVYTAFKATYKIDKPFEEKEQYKSPLQYISAYLAKSLDKLIVDKKNYFTKMVQSYNDKNSPAIIYSSGNDALQAQSQAFKRDDIKGNYQKQREIDKACRTTLRPALFSENKDPNITLFKSTHRDLLASEEVEPGYVQETFQHGKFSYKIIPGKNDPASKVYRIVVPNQNEKGEPDFENSTTLYFNSKGELIHHQFKGKGSNILDGNTIAYKDGDNIDKLHQEHNEARNKKSDGKSITDTALNPKNAEDKSIESRVDGERKVVNATTPTPATPAPTPTPATLAPNPEKAEIVTETSPLQDQNARIKELELENAKLKAENEQLKNEALAKPKDKEAQELEFLRAYKELNEMKEWHEESDKTIKELKKKDDFSKSLTVDQAKLNQFDTQQKSYTTLLTEFERQSQTNSVFNEAAKTAITLQKEKLQSLSENIQELQAKLTKEETKQKEEQLKRDTTEPITAQEIQEGTLSATEITSKIEAFKYYKGNADTGAKAAKPQDILDQGLLEVAASSGNIIALNQLLAVASVMPTKSKTPQNTKDTATPPTLRPANLLAQIKQGRQAKVDKTEQSKEKAEDTEILAYKDNLRHHAQLAVGALQSGVDKILQEQNNKIKQHYDDYITVTTELNNKETTQQNINKISEDIAELNKQITFFKDNSNTTGSSDLKTHYETQILALGGEVDTLSSRKSTLEAEHPNLPAQIKNLKKQKQSKLEHIGQDINELIDTQQGISTIVNKLTPHADKSKINNYEEKDNLNKTLSNILPIVSEEQKLKIQSALKKASVNSLVMFSDSTFGRPAGTQTTKTSKTKFQSLENNTTLQELIKLQEKDRLKAEILKSYSEAFITIQNAMKIIDDHNIKDYKNDVNKYLRELHMAYINTFPSHSNIQEAISFKQELHDYAQAKLKKTDSEKLKEPSTTSPQDLEGAITTLKNLLAQDGYNFEIQGLLEKGGSIAQGAPIETNKERIQILKQLATYEKEVARKQEQFMYFKNQLDSLSQFISNDDKRLAIESSLTDLEKQNDKTNYNKAIAELKKINNENQKLLNNPNIRDNNIERIKTLKNEFQNLYKQSELEAIESRNKYTAFQNAHNPSLEKKNSSEIQSVDTQPTIKPSEIKKQLQNPKQPLLDFFKKQAEHISAENGRPTPTPTPLNPHRPASQRNP